MTFTFNTHFPSLTQLVVCMYHLSGHRLLYFLKNPLFSYFSYRNAYVTKFDLGVNWVKVNPGSSFVYTMMGWCPRCYIPCFVEIGPPVPKEKIFKGFYHILAWRAPWSCDLDHLYKLWIPLPKKAPHKIWL